MYVARFIKKQTKKKHKIHDNKLIFSFFCLISEKKKFFLERLVVQFKHEVFVKTLTSNTFKAS